jgi:GNAT superfamily N-acetyltransferase
MRNGISVTSMTMEPVEYIRSTTADIPMMIGMRREFSFELAGEQSPEIEEALDESQTAYFTRELNKNYFSWHATVDGHVAAIAGMTIRTQPGSIKNPSGRWAYLMLVYTKPQYRKRGISAQLVQRLIGTAKELGITALELHATPEGAPVYERNGFVHHNEPTYRLFI